MKLFLSALFVLAAFTPATIAQKPGQPAIRPADLERRISALVNKERTSKKLTALRLNDALSRIARAHSADMARRNFFSHVNPDGQDPSTRGELAGYACRKIYDSHFTEGLAENIFQGNLYSRVRIQGTEKTYDWNSAEEIANESVDSWMNSPGHRRNILEKNYGETGMGVAISGDDKVYVTQVFC
jgi:uncharacterized protein YkwD